MPGADRTATNVERLSQAVACLHQAIRLIQEVASDISTAFDPGAATPLSRRPATPDGNGPPSGNGSARSAITDRATFCVHWRGRTCYLGDTGPFRLLERLARRPGHLVHCDVLLQELWDCHTSRQAVRSAVKVLRQKLIAAGMEDLAAAIDGRTSHHYGLMPSGRP